MDNIFSKLLRWATLTSVNAWDSLSALLVAANVKIGGGGRLCHLLGTFSDAVRPVSSRRARRFRSLAGVLLVVFAAGFFVCPSSALAQASRAASFRWAAVVVESF